jgi:dolichol-phosphate mannosyltransferase
VFVCLITMDADFSHQPIYLRDHLREIENHDLTIGSRYVPAGGVENWPKYRWMLSRFANWYATTLTGLPFQDLTSGFQCFRTSLMRKILRYRIHTEGYAFLVELKLLAILQQARYKEFPIIFANRRSGDSKISKRVIFESMLFVLKRSTQRRRVIENVRALQRS